MTLTRKIDSYDPACHLQSAYPSWVVVFADLQLRTHELVCADRKLFVIDPAQFGGDERWAMAHIAYHLDKHMGRLHELTGAMCDEADDVALINLDRPADRLRLAC